ncbi:MAG: hypothetical protein ACRDOA_12665 [Streptosporangiaceae bacterium]
MTWDRDRYLADVLEPARRAGNVPPPDLYARYGLSRDLRDQAVFTGQIADVVAFWRELRTRRTYARLAEMLIAAHAELERSGRLTLRSFAERHADARRGQLERLTRLAEAEAGAATHVGPATAQRISGALDGAVSEADIIGALGRAGVRVVGEFPKLPRVPHPKQADLVRYVTQLGVRLSAAVVFGDAVGRGFGILDGFRLADGQVLGETEIAAAGSRIAELSHADPAKAPSENVLAILRAAERKPGDLDALLLSEIVEPLRALARSGFLQRAVATQAQELGLAEDEAGLIAAAILAPDTLDGLRQRIEQELTAGRLRSAQRLAADLPADDPLRERAAAVAADVSALVRRADAERGLGRDEQVAALLAEAIGMARDDAALPERLAAIAPPPPAEASARVDGNHVLITWKPSPASAGPVQYRVMRGTDRAPASPSEGRAAVTRTERTDVTDGEAPAGTELFYSVFAARGGDAWSPPAGAPPVIFIPEVADVSVSVSDASVGASWRPHPGADAVRVVRRQDRPPRGPDDGTAVEASLTGFTDTGLRTGTEYHYQIVTSYRGADGGHRHSAGVVIQAVPEPALRPVDVLDVTGPGDSTTVFVAGWTPPPYGRVRLVLSDLPLPWPAGTCLGPADTAGLAEIPGIPHHGTDGRDVLELRPPTGKHYVTALTLGRNAAVVGSNAEVWLAVPVRGLSAHRMHDEVRLGWIWPDHATDAMVRWPGGEHGCSRRSYEDEGGVVVRIGAAQTTVEVRAIYPRRGGPLISPGVKAQVPARGVAVSYRIRHTSWRPRQRTFELATEEATRLPTLVVVRTTSRYAPDDPHQGETIKRVEPQDISPGQPVTFTVETGKGPAWVACFVDPDTPAAPARGILLFPPPGEEMRIR